VVLVIAFLFLFLLLLAACVAAPWWGTDTSDDRSEAAHPQAGWFPPLPSR